MYQANKCIWFAISTQIRIIQGQDFGGAPTLYHASTEQVVVSIQQNI